MSTRSMIDYAFPIIPPPVQTDIVLVYVGGDTPHPWTDADMHSQSARYRLPCWVRSNPQSADATSDANQMIAWLKAHNVPVNTCIVLDLETAVDAVYVKTFNTILSGAGYRTIKYGSKNFIFKNPQTSGGTWVPDLTDVPHMYTVGDTVATQYIFASGYDLSEVLDNNQVPLWDTNSIAGEPGFPTPIPGKSVISVTASWNPVIGAESYHFQLVRVSDQHVITDISVNGTVTQATVPGLANNTAYAWRVAVHATSTMKASRWTAWQTITV
jgi:hypothetical protein